MKIIPKAKKQSLIPKRRTFYVPHPHYGSQPRFTGLDVDKQSSDVYLNCRTEEESKAAAKNFPILDPAFIGHLIPGTAIIADPSKQYGSCMVFTHYYDIERKCRDCGRLFIFYAQEQRYWYEELKFPVDADCVRCHPCRKVMREIEQVTRSYEELMALVEPTADQQASMAEHRLILVSAGRFNSRQLEAVRAFINRFPDHPKTSDLCSQLAEIA